MHIQINYNILLFIYTYMPNILRIIIHRQVSRNGVYKIIDGRQSLSTPRRPVSPPLMHTRTLTHTTNLIAVGPCRSSYNRRRVRGAEGTGFVYGPAGTLPMKRDTTDSKWCSVPTQTVGLPSVTGFNASPFKKYISRVSSHVQVGDRARSRV